ncbi:MAG TPA: SET domain-containing protein-lysine N-methyltransferase [Patescibacteria group bacterium]|nr:SET domain-containing protein-lysine N-methyltransferase [Patescibacteria group bacterium]
MLTPGKSQPVDCLVDTDLVLFQNSSIHGMGGFAARDILPGTTLLEYKGEKIDKGESARRCELNNVFIFSLNEDYDLDGDASWNTARLLNHSCLPNCEAQIADARIWIVATRPIRAGQEITFNYGFDLENYRDYPCRCGAPNCVGFIVAEEFFDHVRKQNALRLACNPISA